MTVQLNLETAKVGDVLDDGSIVLQKSNGIALLVAPTFSDVQTTWSPEFPTVSQILREYGFTPSQWFVPTKEQLQLAYETIPEHFSSTFYWSSTEYNNDFAWFLNFNEGSISRGKKTYKSYVRAFRCVTYDKMKVSEDD
jgi:hypothetical protein